MRFDAARRLQSLLFGDGSAVTTEYPEATPITWDYASLARRRAEFSRRAWPPRRTLELVATEREYQSTPDADEKLARYIARGTEAMATVRALIEQLETKGVLNASDGALVRERAAEIDRELRDTP